MEEKEFFKCLCSIRKTIVWKEISPGRYQEIKLIFDNLEPKLIFYAEPPRQKEVFPLSEWKKALEFYNQK